MKPDSFKITGWVFGRPNMELTYLPKDLGKSAFQTFQKIPKDLPIYTHIYPWYPMIYQYIPMIFFFFSNFSEKNEPTRLRRSSEPCSCPRSKWVPQPITRDTKIDEGPGAADISESQETDAPRNSTRWMDESRISLKIWCHLGVSENG